MSSFSFKQLVFLNSEHLKRFSPKMLNVVRKRLFTISSKNERQKNVCQTSVRHTFKAR
jgi:hypothetical protein